MTDIILINPPFDKEDQDLVELRKRRDPLGILYIAAAARESGYSVRILDLQVESIGLRKAIAQEKPKVVGISGLTITRFESFNIARIIKSVFPEIVTAYGGPHASCAAQDTLENIPEIDIIIRGEGEITFLELCNVFVGRKGSLKDLPGISYRCDGKIIHNPGRVRIRNLDSLPFPARDLVNMDRYKFYLHYLQVDSLSLMASRGCFRNCIFCAERNFWGNSCIRRSQGNILEEIMSLVRNYNIRTFIFSDSSFTADRAFVFSLCEEFIKNKLNIRWGCQTNISYLDTEILELMKSSGCCAIGVGAESAVPRVLTKINKNYSLDYLDHIIESVTRLKMGLPIFWMIGLPEETLDEALKSYHWFSKYKENKFVILSFPRPTEIFPGTSLEAWARERGYLPKDFSWSDPYYAPQNRYFSSSVRQPLLIQPQFGYKEYKELFKLYTNERIHKEFGISHILRHICNKKNVSYSNPVNFYKRFRIYKNIIRKNS